MKYELIDCYLQWLRDNKKGDNKSNFAKYCFKNFQGMPMRDFLLLILYETVKTNKRLRKINHD